MIAVEVSMCMAGRIGREPGAFRWLMGGVCVAAVFLGARRTSNTSGMEGGGLN
jgi:hypothetical protein